MNSNKIFSVLLMLAGEAILIICFLYFGSNLTTGILTMNIIVSSIVYALFLLDILFPMVDFKDKSQKTIGSLGLRWFFTSLYTLAAIVAMIIFNTVKPIDLNSQILIHAIILFFLMLGLYMSISSSQKVQEVYTAESKTRDHITEMKKATKDVMLRLEKMQNIPSDINSRINLLYENLRFISPSDNKDAFKLESDYLIEINAVKDCLFDIPLNQDKIKENIQHCESTYKERKQIFSN
jgi:uncharacterized protein (UPF0333 family)